MPRIVRDIQLLVNDDDDHLYGYRLSDGTEVRIGSSQPENAAAVVGAAGVVGAMPSGEYYVALRAPQTGNGSPLDQSGKLRDPAVNAVLFPPTWQAGTAYSLGAYRSPTSPTGVLYKCTTAGTSGASEPTWTTTLGATVSDGTAVWTAELGPWPTSASGYRHLAALQQASLPGAGSYDLGAVTWDLANNDSFILRIRQAWHADNDSRNNLSETSVMGSRHASTNRRGIQVLGTGGNYCDLKFFVSDGTNTVGSGHVGDGQAGRPNFSRKPLDGNVRETCFMVDGVTKTMFCFGDGVAYSQAEMYGAGELTPHNRSLSAVTGSTQSPNNFLIGGIPGSGTTADFGLIMFDLIVLRGRALPANIQAVADFFNQRGASGALLPASLLI